MFMLIRIVVWFALGLAVSAHAAEAPRPPPPKFDAASYMLMDFHSGATLASRNPDQRVEPASITKLMTTYVAFKALRAGDLSLSDSVKVSEKAWRKGGSTMYIEVGTRVSVEDLLRGIIVQSGNDASVALAEHIAGTESAFAQLMNHEAKRLGMTGTHYVNATGWPDPEHYTTARDTAILARHVIRDFPDHYEMYSERKYTYDDITQFNRNRLLWRDASVDGLKTGHTESAGYCLVSSAKREDMRLIAVVMGTPSDRARTADSQALLNYGFRSYETHKLYAAGDPIATPRVWKGATEKLGLGVAKDLYVTVPRNRYDDLQISSKIDGPIVAPVKAGQTLGQLAVSLDDQGLERVPLKAQQSVAEGGVWRWTVDSALLLFE